MVRGGGPGRRPGHVWQRGLGRSRPKPSDERGSLQARNTRRGRLFDVRRSSGSSVQHRGGGEGVQRGLEAGGLRAGRGAVRARGAGGPHLLGRRGRCSAHRLPARRPPGRVSGPGGRSVGQPRPHRSIRQVHAGFHGRSGLLPPRGGRQGPFWPNRRGAERQRLRPRGGGRRGHGGGTPGGGDEAPPRDGGHAGKPGRLAKHPHHAVHRPVIAAIRAAHGQL
mmetsp:Transcript_17282/g.44330  ORF Transcript_17282/g.44330 Transcript_17282/m.44330 type:complete len:222 (-) Transcript_17282:56-721(-)